MIFLGDKMDTSILKALFIVAAIVLFVFFNLAFSKEFRNHISISNSRKNKHLLKTKKS